MSKRASYRAGVAWIAWNDSAGEADALVPEDVAGLISVGLLADLFGKDTLDVAKDIVHYREKNGVCA